MKPEITILDKSFTTFIEPDTIQKRITELAQQLNRDYAGKQPLMIAILNGAFIFAADLFRVLDIDASISFVKLASYKGTTSTGNVVTAIGLDENLHDRHIIIVEDIVDTGRTLSAFLPEIQQRGPASVKIATFLSKPSAQLCGISPDYVAFEIENNFVVGYGLDYDGHGRNYPGLYILKS